MMSDSDDGDGIIDRSWTTTPPASAVFEHSEVCILNHEAEIIYGDSFGIQAVHDGRSVIPSIMLHPGDPFLLNGHADAAIFEQAGGRVVG
jgi:hypothetical protein